MYICMICMYVCIYISMCARMYVCVHARDPPWPCCYDAWLPSVSSQVRDSAGPPRLSWPEGGIVQGCLYCKFGKDCVSLIFAYFSV